VPPPSSCPFPRRPVSCAATARLAWPTLLQSLYLAATFPDRTECDLGGTLPDLDRLRSPCRLFFILRDRKAVTPIEESIFRCTHFRVMKLLIISPHFPPSNAADMQRIRLVSGYLGENEIEVVILAVESDQVSAPKDDFLSSTVPAALDVQRTRALGIKWGKMPGLGTLSNRAIHALGRAGDKLLKAKPFDLVYFSTTQFGIHLLGPRWKQKFGVPFVMDYQDPWVNDYYRNHPEVTPPGGRLKYSVVDRINRVNEPKVLRHCSGITSVSKAYPKQLESRYPWLRCMNWADRKPSSTGKKERQLPSLIAPFPGDARDFSLIRESSIQQNVFDPSDGKIHWVYVGRGGEDMALALGGLFYGIRERLRNDPEMAKSLQLHFVGTSYAAAGSGKKTVLPIAEKFGLAAIVEEDPDRIPYSETLRCLLDADALIVPGSDDPAYTASKIYSYLLADKPMLAIFHKESSVTSLIETVGGGSVVSFSSSDSTESLGMRIASSVFSENLTIPSVALDHDRFAPHTARSEAARFAEFFRYCLAREQEQSQENGN